MLVYGLYVCLIFLHTPSLLLPFLNLTLTLSLSQPSNLLSLPPSSPHSSPLHGHPLFRTLRRMCRTLKNLVSHRRRRETWKNFVWLVYLSFCMYVCMFIPVCMSMPILPHFPILSLSLIDLNLTLSLIPPSLLFFLTSPHSHPFPLSLLSLSDTQQEVWNIKILFGWFM
jgi:hypothetical protein